MHCPVAERLDDGSRGLKPTAKRELGRGEKARWGVEATVNYVGGKFSYHLSDHWRLEGGAQYQALGKYEERIGGRKAELDLGQAIFVTAGLSYSL